MPKKSGAKYTPAERKELKATKLSPTLVTFLLDRSSSMSIIKDSTIEAFNGYLDSLRKEESIRFSLVQFDHHTETTANGKIMTGMQLEKVCVDVPIVAAPNLDDRNYQPRGATPLIDAAYTVIKAVEVSLVGRPLDTKVVVCIQTDGEENCSREYSWEQLSALIKAKQDKGWQFNFMGAGIDAYQQGAKMGLSAANTMSYDSSVPAMARASFAASASNTSSFAAGLSANTSYSTAQKVASGDKFDPQGAKARNDLLKTLHGGAASFTLATHNSPPAPKQDEKFKL